MCKWNKEEYYTTRETFVTNSNHWLVFDHSCNRGIEKWEEAIIDLPDDFPQFEMDDVVPMVLKGKLAELMVKVVPQFYRKYVSTGKKGKIILNVVLQKALYGCLKSACLFHLKLITEWKAIWFKYDPHVVKKMMNRGQMTITFLANYFKISHHNKE